MRKLQLKVLSVILYNLHQSYKTMEVLYRCLWHFYADIEMECLATWKDGSETYLYARLTGAQLRSRDERFRCFVSCFSAKLHYTDTGYGQIHHQRTKFATSQCQSPTSRHVKMLRCGKFLSVAGEFCCTASCRIVGSLSVVVFVGGVVQHVHSRCPCSGVWHFYAVCFFTSYRSHRPTI